LVFKTPISTKCLLPITSTFPPQFGSIFLQEEKVIKAKNSKIKVLYIPVVLYKDNLKAGFAA
jgi:hypothetical protein